MAEGLQKDHFQFRLAFAIACGLAICGAVMFITADANEVVLASGYNSHTTSSSGDLEAHYTHIIPKVIRSKMAQTSDVSGRWANKDVATSTGREKKVVSVDVKKAGTIIFNTPDGRGKLLDYLNKVERHIATEVASRKADIAAIRIKMAKNMAYNQKARATMRKDLMKRMERNAKKAKRELDRQMRWTANMFAKQAALENKRNAATIARSKKTREIMRKNKRHYQHNLKIAVLNQQRALAALSSATNAKIHRTNKNIAANAAQIKINARKARKDLEHAMNNFNKKMYAVTLHARQARSKLSAEMKSNDRKVRAMVGNKIAQITALTAAQFRQVRAQMAKDRHRADMALSHATQRMSAALKANKILQNRRFAQTIADINKAKAEAKARVAKATRAFKLNLLRLSSLVRSQVFKLNSRVTQLAGVVTKNRLEQARVNKNVAAETKRMIKIGNDRENKLAKQNKTLRTLMDKNKHAQEHRMQQMAKKFMVAIGRIRSQARKDRSFQERRLASETGKLYNTLRKNMLAQSKRNKSIAAATRRARLDAMAALRATRNKFATRLSSLHATVVKNDRKANHAIHKLTGIEAANALKSAQGRQMLKMLSQSNKMEIKNAVRQAVRKGEMHALKIEKRTKAMNKKTIASLNMRITTEISTLSKKIHTSVEDLQLASAKSRAEMKREVMYAVRSAAKLAKKNLKASVKESNAQFLKLEKALEKSKAYSAAKRADLRRRVDEENKRARRAITDAVTAQARALLALKEETAKKIKKTNHRVDAYGRAVYKHAKQISAQMAANVGSLNKKVAAARAATKRALKTANHRSAARHSRALQFISRSLNAAKKATNRKFGKVYAQMGLDRAAADRKLARAVASFNNALAKRSVLADRRFRLTVKNIKAAKQAAWNQVKHARTEFTMGLAAVTASVKAQESRLTGEIAVVSSMIISNRAAQVRVNRRTNAELKRIVRIADARYSSSKRARGKLRRIFNMNKAIAAQEISHLKKSTSRKLAKLRGYQAALKREAAKDLTKATRKLYRRISTAEYTQRSKMKRMSRSLAMRKATAAAAIRRARKDFNSKFSSLVNTVTANNKKFEKGLKHITGVAYNWKTKNAADRKLIREENKAMQQDLNKAITRAIQLGEAKAKAIQERAFSNIGAMKKALQGEIAERVERMGDRVFKTINHNRAKSANNYLAVKGYAGATRSRIVKYIQSGRGRNLLSVGDFLQSVALFSSIRTKAAYGVGAGATKVLPAFGGKLIPVVSELNKVNGLVNEYMKIITSVRLRWRMGLGKYLLGKVAKSMQGKGILTVGKVEGKAGKWVYVSGHALGLSNRMSDFTKLSCRLHHYQSFLAKLSAKLPSHMAGSKAKVFDVKPPEWQGN